MRNSNIVQIALQHNSEVANEDERVFSTSEIKALVEAVSAKKSLKVQYHRVGDTYRNPYLDKPTGKVNSVFVYLTDKSRIQITKSAKVSGKFNLIKQKPVTTGWTNLSPVIGYDKSFSQIKNIFDKLVEATPGNTVKTSAPSGSAGIPEEYRREYNPDPTRTIKDMNGVTIKIGDYVSFQSDVVVTGKVIAISNDLTAVLLENLKGFNTPSLGKRTHFTYNHLYFWKATSTKEKASVETAAEVMQMGDDPAVDNVLMELYRANKILDTRKDTIFFDHISIANKFVAQRALRAYDEDYLLRLPLSLGAIQELAQALIDCASRFKLSASPAWTRIAGGTFNLAVMDSELEESDEGQVDSERVSADI